MNNNKVEITDEGLVPDELCTVTVTMPATVFRKRAVELTELGASFGPRVPSLSLIAEALGRPCGHCDGGNRGKCIDCGVMVSITETRQKGYCSACHEDFTMLLGCPECGGSGKQSVPGARLKAEKK